MNLRPLPLVLCSALLAPGLLPTARAQEFVRVTATAGGDFGMASRVSRRSVEKYAEMLNLTADQKAMAVSLHEGYEAAASNSQKDFQASMQEIQKSFQETQDESVWSEKMPKTRQEYQARTKALEKGLFDDLKSLLTTEQQGNWGAVERHRRRETVLRTGMGSGESVDLVQIVEGLKLAPDAKAALAQTMGDYELELDRALAAKQSSLGQGAAFEPGKRFDPEEMRQRLEKSREEGQKVKEVNQRHTRRIEGLLPEEKKAEFQKAVQAASFPRVYRPSAIARKIDAALGLADLDARQRESLQQLKESYQRDVGPANDRWAAAIAEQEKSGKDGGTMAVPGMGVMSVNFGGEEKGPVADARKARREVDERARGKLDGVLTKEQKDKLPKESPMGEDGHMIMDGGAMPVMIRTTEDVQRK